MILIVTFVPYPKVNTLLTLKSDRGREIRWEGKDPAEVVEDYKEDNLILRSSFPYSFRFSLILLLLLLSIVDYSWIAHGMRIIYVIIKSVNSESLQHVLVCLD